MYCIKCGAVIDNDSRFCVSCGAVQGNTPTASQVTPNPSSGKSIVMKPFKPVSLSDTFKKFPMPLNKKNIRKINHSIDYRAIDAISADVSYDAAKVTMKALFWMIIGIPLAVCWYPMVFMCWLGYLAIYTVGWLISSRIGSKNGTEYSSINPPSEKVKGALNDFVSGFKEGYKSMSNSDDDY